MHRSVLPLLVACSVVLAFAACSSDPVGGLDLDIGGGSTDVDNDVGGFDAAVDAAADVTPDADAISDGGSDAVDATDADVDTGPEEGAFGWPCGDDDECDSGYCIQPAAGEGRICTEPCLGECPYEGFACLPVENLDGDQVFLCLPDVEPTCRPCETAADCGSLAASCVTLLDGQWCALPCGEGDTCPDGMFCSGEATDDGLSDVCIPATETCTDCYDPDDDGRGIGTDCPFEGVDCAPMDPSVYTGAIEQCDGLDNDCDDAIDEDYDLTNDLDHCGACGVVCEGAGSTQACVDSACVIVACDEGLVDCDGDPLNGCERTVDSLNACGGCAALDGMPGSGCGTCDTGEWVCDGEDALRCAGDAGDDALNACGGCARLDGDPGADCGTCGSGAWVCDGVDAVSCTDDAGDEALNVCGGCGPIDGDAGERCGTCDSGTYVCSGLEALFCVGDDGDDALNACGGCESLGAAPGTSCGACGSGAWACDGADGLVCEGDEGDDVRNACGGCSTLDETPGTPCGTCGSGTWVCNGGDGLRCEGDLGDGARNACGGCAVLDEAIGVACGPCGDGETVCNGINAVTCAGATPDRDGDTVCDPDDVCPGGDDRLDRDRDEIPDACDDCPDDPLNDSDADEVCDGADVCIGFDDRVDTDRDGVPDGCDVCAGGNDASDADRDGTPDFCDCDVDHCAAIASCTESDTGVSCDCPGGYRGDGRTCTDIDECAEGSDRCDGVATCTNTPGSYTCRCPDGYRGDGFSCVDVNECAEGSDLCDPNAACTNTTPGYSCTCNPGYTGDGFTCTASAIGCVDGSVEFTWAPGVVACRGPTQAWGTYRDNVGSYCSPGWSMAGESIVNAHLTRTSHVDNVKYAFDGGTCTAREGWYFATRYRSYSQSRSECGWSNSHHWSLGSSPSGLVDGIVCAR